MSYGRRAGCRCGEASGGSEEKRPTGGVGATVMERYEAVRPRDERTRAGRLMPTNAVAGYR